MQLDIRGVSKTYPNGVQALKDVTLTIPAGSTSGIINFGVKGDTVWEPDETFYVNLSNATNAVIIDEQGTGTILNDDPASADLVSSGVLHCYGH